MKYVVIAIILLASIHTFSFAKYNWNNNKKKAAVGSVLIALIAVVLPTVVILIR